MPTEASVLSDEQRDRIVALDEGHFADLKAKEIGPAKLSKAISAFANADGGELYIGIAEERHTKIRHWRGFSDFEAANDHIRVFSEILPLGEGFSYEFLSHPSEIGLVLQVSVRKTRTIVTATDGEPYIRRGAQSLHVSSAAALEQLRRNKGITSFETETVAARLDEVTNSATVIEFMLAVIPTAEPVAWLRKQQAIIDDKPTVAGVVLFADEPQARYATSQAAGTRETLVGDPATIEGCVYAVIQRAVEHTQAIISEIRRLGPAGLEQIEYPTETLHEIITNAVLHRDYSLMDDVHVRIFDNRVEVESPGTLPAHITAANILTERFARNGMIVRLINKFPNPPNKDVGEGLNTAFAAMRRLRLRDPEIEPRANSVVVHIRHDRLASAEDMVMEYLGNHPSISNQIARELTGIPSENSMKDVFYRLRDRELIERVPGRDGPRAAWRRKTLTPA